MNTAFLLTGSNLGDRESALAKAREALMLDGSSIRKISSIYETASWGKTNLPAYLNQAL